MQPVAIRMVVKACGFASAAVLLFMMLFTAYAVVSRQIFDTPLLGVVEVMELSLVLFIFLAMPGVFFRDENVTVDILDSMMSSGMISFLRKFALILALLFFGVSLYAMVPASMEKYNSFEITQTLGIHKFVHWVPILFGFAGAILGALWVLLRGPVRDLNIRDRGNPDDGNRYEQSS